MAFILPYLVAISASITPPQLAVENCRIGEAYAFSAVECQIALANHGEKPIRVFDTHAITDGDSVEPGSLTIAPHAQSYLHVKMNTGNSSADTEHFFRFHSDEKGNEDRVASASVFAMTILDQAKPELDFGVVNLPADTPQKTIELSSHDVADFRVSKILDKPAWLNASLSKDGHLTVSVRSDAGWGLHSDFIKLALNTTRQPQAWVAVKADVHGEVIPASNPFDMGLMRLGNHNEFRIPLTSRSGNAFKIGKIELDGLDVRTQLSLCEPIRDGCQTLILDVPDQKSGTIQGRVWIELPEFHQHLSVNVWGLLVPQDLKIKTLAQGKASENDAATETNHSLAESDSPANLKRAIDEAVINAAGSTVPPGTGPLLKWTIANGLGIYGFQIFRAIDEGGPFILLNPSTIRSTAMTQDPNSYQWRDNAAASGKTYWYYIGILYNDGHKQQLTGPQKVVAK